MTSFRLFKPEDEIPNVRPFDWDVVIYSRPYYVTRFEGFVHSIGGEWGENDLWAWPRDEKPSWENLIEFNGPGGALWGIKYEPWRHTKSKWDETEVRVSHPVLITRNGKAFYELHGGLDYGVNKAIALITEINEHALELNEIDFDQKMIGRKVWWRSEPAVITSWIGHGQACVILEPDGIERFTVPPEFADEDPDYYEDNEVKTSIFDKHIWWFRE